MTVGAAVTVPSPLAAAKPAGMAAKIAYGLGATAATLVGGLASLPFVLATLVRKNLPSPRGRFASVGSVVQRDATGLVVRIFYPLSEEAPAGGSPWLPAPQSLYVEGLTKFLNLPGAVGSWLLSAGLRGVIGPWIAQDVAGALPGTVGEKLPVVVFSQGLGGFQTVYSIVCCELASNGVSAPSACLNPLNEMTILVRLSSRLFGKEKVQTRPKYGSILTD